MEQGGQRKALKGKRVGMVFTAHNRASASKMVKPRALEDQSKEFALSRTLVIRPPADS
jgi:hypothetical protein